MFQTQTVGVASSLLGEPRDVVLLAVPGVSSLEVAGPAEAFRISEPKMREAGRLQGRPYRIRLLGTDRSGVIPTSCGIRLFADGHFEDYNSPVDTLLVVGGPDVWTGRDMPELLTWLQSTAGAARRVGAICTGAFVLAEAGLLNGKRATTHWFFCHELAQNYPSVLVDPEPIYIREGKISTTAGVTAGLDLVLAMIEEDLGLDIALRVARALVLYVRRPGWQSQFSTALGLQSTSRLAFRDLPFWILEHLREPLTLESLAARLAMSPRNFSRQFRKEFGTTPQKFVQQLRMEMARRLVHESTRTREEIAFECGFGSVDALDRALKRERPPCNKETTL